MRTAAGGDENIGEEHGQFCNLGKSLLDRIEELDGTRLEPRRLQQFRSDDEGPAQGQGLAGIGSTGIRKVQVQV